MMKLKWIIVLNLTSSNFSSDRVSLEERSHLIEVHFVIVFVLKSGSRVLQFSKFKRMILTTGIFLYNLLCALVPCELKYKPPEFLPEPKNFSERVMNLAKENTDPIVNTQNGLVQGYLTKSTNGRSIFAFEGVPYAETTGGANRWRPPVPKKPWSGVWKATKPGSECLQISLQKLLRVHGSENCLFLNVYTPNIPSSITYEKTYPVVVLIHGGSFIFGRGDEFLPAYLLNEDVILVTMNYRLGVMGFLSTGDKHLPGNYGLKDQALALKWVHDNIERFGGNNKNVTLMGNSAGAVSVHLHMISNTSREYFSTAYSSSGTAFHFWSVQSKERMRYFANKLAARFGCQNEQNSKMLIKCLKKIDPNYLVVAQTSLFDWFPTPPVMFSPVVEPNLSGAFLTISPEEAYKSGVGGVANKPYIIGVTKDEGKLALMIMLIFMRTLSLRIMWDQIAPAYLQYWWNSAPMDISGYRPGDSQAITKKVSEFYFKGQKPLMVSDEPLVEMFTDRYLTFGAIKGVQAHVSYGAPTYLYYFSFSEGAHNVANSVGYKSSEWGAGHVEDMMYMFNDPDLVDGHRKNEPDSELSGIMVKLLVNFASTGIPSYTSEDGRTYQIWEPVQNISELRALKFDRQVEMIPFPQNEINRLNFWNNLNLSDTSLLAPLRYSKY